LTQSLLDDDLEPVEEELAVLNGQVGAIQDLLGGAVGGAPSPTPAPLVAATADDDPFIGPDDASVTVIEFTDYQ
jgi:protein-disulfide isomerase